VAAQSKAQVSDRSLAANVNSNSVGGMDICLSLVNVVCCQVEVSATGRSLVQRNHTVCMCACVRVCVRVCLCHWV
jgi:hypothetical protein